MSTEDQDPNKAVLKTEGHFDDVKTAEVFGGGFGGEAPAEKKEAPAGNPVVKAPSV